MESCIGCGQAAVTHPYVGIGREDLTAGTGPMVGHPVCLACWQDPAHRVLGNPKVSYAPRDQAAWSVAASNALDEKSKRGEPLTLG